MKRVHSCPWAKDLEPLLKPLGFKDALMLFGIVINEPMLIRKKLTMSCSTWLSTPLIQTQINITKGFLLQGFAFHRNYVWKEWGVFLHGMLLHTDLKPTNILSQLGSNHVCLDPDGRACASQRWNSRREKPIHFSWAIRKADMKPVLPSLRHLKSSL